MSRDRTKEAHERRLEDDLRWHRVTAELGLGPELGAGEPATGPAPGADAGLRRGIGPLRGAVAALLATLGLVALVVVARLAMVAAAELLPGFLGAKPLKFYVAVAHVVVVGLVLVLLASGPAPVRPHTPVARRAFDQLLLGWRALWLAWLGLYVWLTLLWGGAVGAGDSASSAWAVPVADVLNIASSAVFLYLFLVLDKPSVKAAGEPERDRAFRRALHGVGVLCAAVGACTVLGRFELLGLARLGPALGSVLAAIAMAFFFGRLSDSHLKARRVLLAPLYLYVSIQMLWHLFVTEEVRGDAAGGEVASNVVLCAALLLKVYLFAVVARWIATGTLQTYFDEVAYPRLASDLEEE